MNNNYTKENLKIAFFGTGPVAESAIYSLYKNNFDIKLIVTKPDSKVGRKQVLTAPMIKQWGKVKNIKVLQPKTLRKNNSPIDTDESNELEELIKDLENIDLAIVASYGLIIPEYILNIPKLGFLNIHPSDLPLLRGPSPIESQLLSGQDYLTISLMKLDAGMDSGDILTKTQIRIDNTDTTQTLELKSGQIGGDMLSNIIIEYANENIKLQKQDDSQATFCKFVEKSESEIKLTDNLESIRNKWRAYFPWPGIFFIHESKEKDNNIKQIRVKINKINLLNIPESIDDLIISVTPEGRNEITWEDFKHGYMK